MSTVLVCHSIGPVKHNSNYDTAEAVVGSKGLLTFDGVYRNVYEHREMLRGREVVLFVTGHYCGKDNSWDPGQPLETFCSWAELYELRDVYGFELGWHTWTHPDLRLLGDEQLAFEVTPPPTIPMTKFAYPYGRVDQRVIDAVREAGFEKAYTVGRTDGTEWTIPRKHL